MDLRLAIEGTTMLNIVKRIFVLCFFSDTLVAVSNTELYNSRYATNGR